MATHPTAPLDTLLAVLPTLPRPLLARVAARLIDRLDEIDGDPDMEEDNEDRGIDTGEPDYRPPPSHMRTHLRRLYGPGCIDSDSDYGGEEAGEAENGIVHPTYGIDQSAGPLSPHAH